MREHKASMPPCDHDECPPTCCAVFFDLWLPDPVGVILGTGYHKFRHSSGIEGLAKVTRDMLEVLAVFATDQGTGQFRRFVAGTKEQFGTVIVWEDWNPQVGAALKRYGFERHERIEPDGEHLVGWRWSKPNVQGHQPAIGSEGQHEDKR